MARAPKQKFAIVSVAEARDLRLRPAELSVVEGVERLTRIVDGRREEALRLPVELIDGPVAVSMTAGSATVRRQSNQASVANLSELGKRLMGAAGIEHPGRLCRGRVPSRFRPVVGALLAMTEPLVQPWLTEQSMVSTPFRSGDRVDFPTGDGKRETGTVVGFLTDEAETAFVDAGIVGTTHSYWHVPVADLRSVR